MWTINNGYFGPSAYLFHSFDHMRTREHQENRFVRDKSELNISNFLEELHCIDWFNVDGYNDPKICYSKFLER